ncbi:MAG: helix-turn-helix domain-containing protein [Solirubrobacteraceae bacterium MAG38_C4-C5]|nr:helix-turn-helix domain-containing protein [Candidatus Siliceabacter maunaloa]
MAFIDLLPANQPDAVLAQPSRARLFALLAELRRPAGVEKLAQATGLHPNGVRIHLQRLADEGLLERTTVSSGIGRHGRAIGREIAPAPTMLPQPAPCRPRWRRWASHPVTALITTA